MHNKNENKRSHGDSNTHGNHLSIKKVPTVNSSPCDLCVIIWRTMMHEYICSHTPSTRLNNMSIYNFCSIVCMCLKVDYHRVKATSLNNSYEQ